jgi:ankyrin repeat protein
MILLTRILTGLLFTLVAGASLAPANGSEETTLIEAAAVGDTDRVLELLEGGAPVDQRDGHGRTALLIATRADHAAVARHLIGAGADVNAKDRMQDTPFLYAGAEGRNAILSLILATGRAKLDDTNRYGGVALIPAAHHGHPETVRMLISAGVDVDHVNDLGWTALLEAVILGDGGPVYQEIVGLLIEAGAKPIADRDGRTPLDHALQRGQSEIAAMLKRRQAA